VKRGGALAVAVLAASLAAAPRARAAADGAATATPEAPPPPLVVVVGSAEDEPLTGRIAAELRALRIAVDLRLAPASEDEARAKADFDSALREGARAAVRVDSRAGRIEVSIADVATGGVAMHEVLEGPATASVAPVLAVRTVEFVRAALLGPPSVPEPVAPPTTVTRSVELPPPPPAEPRAAPIFSFTLGSGVAGAAGGLGPQGALGAEVRVGLGRRLGLEAIGLAPLTTQSVVSMGSDNAQAALWMVGGGAFARVALSARGGLELGVGGLALFMRITGTPNPGYVGSSAWGLGSAAYGRVGATLALSRVIAARVDLLAGSTLRRPVAVHTEPWGPAFGAALGGVEARWF
jgi:hypothetical protein